MSCGRRPSAQQISPCAIDSDVEPSGHGHPSSRAEAVEQCRVSLPAIVPECWRGSMWLRTIIGGQKLRVILETPGTASTARISCE